MAGATLLGIFYPDLSIANNDRKVKNFLLATLSGAGSWELRSVPEMNISARSEFWVALLCAVIAALLFIPATEGTVRALGVGVAFLALVWAIVQDRWRRQSALVEAHVPILRARQLCGELVQRHNKIEDSKPMAAAWAVDVIAKQIDIEQHLSAVVRILTRTSGDLQRQASTAYWAFGEALRCARAIGHPAPPPDLAKPDPELARMGITKLVEAVSHLTDLETKTGP